MEKLEKEIETPGLTIMDKVQILENQLKHRLDKLWKIFSWTSTLLIAIIGGMMAIARDGDVEIGQKIAILAVVTILMIYANNWLKENLKREKKIRKALKNVLENDKIQIKQFDENGNVVKSKEVNLYGYKLKTGHIGYRKVIWVLGFITALATCTLDVDWKQIF